MANKDTKSCPTSLSLATRETQVKTTATGMATIKMTDNKHWEEIEKLESQYIDDEIT